MNFDLKDCNNCRHHIQAASPEEIPSRCRDCMTDPLASFPGWEREPAERQVTDNEPDLVFTNELDQSDHEPDAWEPVDIRDETSEDWKKQLAAAMAEAGQKLDEQPAPTCGAPEVLRTAAELIEERGRSRDCPNGERAMARTVQTFNAMTGHALTEEEGWLFMVYLKHSRMRAGAFNRDDYEDATAYEALMSECAIREDARYAKLSEENDW